MWCVSVQKGGKGRNGNHQSPMRIHFDKLTNKRKRKQEQKQKKKVIKHKNFTKSDNHLVTDQGNTERPGNSLTIAKHQRPDAHNQNARDWLPQTTGHVCLHIVF